MKKIIIILILLSIISVVGCANEQGIPKKTNWKKSDEQTIQTLEKEVRDLEEENNSLRKAVKYSIEALANIGEEVDDIKGIVEEFELGYYTKSDAIDEIYGNIYRIDDIFDNIIKKLEKIHIK